MEEIALQDWVIRLAVAAVLSGAIGFEREASQKAAGLRTNVLVGLGAAVFTLVSIDGFPGGDPSRVAAQVVTGVGFLGAGAIVRHGVTVEGLTTAASLWGVAAIGLASGAGEMAAAVIAAALALIVLSGLRIAERIMRNRTARFGVLVDVRVDALAAVGGVIKMVDRIRPRAEIVGLQPDRAGGGTLRLRMRPDTYERVSALVHAVDGVTGIVRVDQ